jgi:radical SAM superfamily enzyme YgiQ (UPF0313 family)
MHYEGTIYRPPVEANSLLLQVTVGCAHNKCTFCNMYKDVCFRMEKLEQIEEDLKEARRYYKKVERIFLVNGDAFVLKADYLKAIAIKIREYFPECNTITMYSSIQNIKSKTDEELKELRALGINDLYVGIESGSDEVVARINKGHTVQEAIEQLQRLNEANINHMALLMLGVAGKGKGIENAKATAEFLNVTKPKLIWVGTLAVFPGTKLQEEVEAGTFVEASEIENLIEEKTLIENIQLENVPFYGVHPTNAIPVAGILPRDKEKMLEALEYGIQNFDEKAFAKKIKRTSL